MGAAPELSIILYVHDQVHAVSELLAALASDPDLARAEILVADTDSLARTSAVASSRIQGSRVFHWPQDTMQTAKAKALFLCRADLVAILDSTAVPSGPWIGSVIKAFANSATVGVAGSVEYGGIGSPGDRAAYLFEYGAFAPPIPSGSTLGDLPGNSVAYRRADLIGAAEPQLRTVGFIKPFAQARLRARGGELHLRSELRATLRSRYDLVAFARKRFHFGRCFGGRRLSELSARKRWGLRLLGWSLPVLLWWRVRRRSLRHPRTRELWRGAATSVFMITAAWGFGEWLGACLGPGRSCERVT